MYFSDKFYGAFRFRLTKIALSLLVPLTIARKCDIIMDNYNRIYLSVRFIAKSHRITNLAKRKNGEQNEKIQKL